ncbi:hypothetical protein Csa_017592 [Cucumis sativus]|uniref:Uncharacterized protein n=1 Tax=Cucumis sativus TaxID=3659 RepID=A0A0A0LC87_CUCSA|nr:hypothetical protein Csa_017592 [Cucumis sativus]
MPGSTLILSLHGFSIASVFHKSPSLYRYKGFVARRASQITSSRISEEIASMNKGRKERDASSQSRPFSSQLGMDDPTTVGDCNLSRFRFPFSKSYLTSRKS